MILITGGGTGGHLSIARSLKEAFNELGEPVVYVGSTRGQDRSWFENESGFEATYFLQSGGVVDKKGIAKLSSLARIFEATLQARKILRRHRVKAVVSVGGYAAAPASFAAIVTRTPLFIHEQNAHTGRLNKVLRPFGRRFFCSFLPPYDPYPVNPSFYHKRRLRTKLQRVIFLGGSQGAAQINRIALQMAPSLANKGIRIIHQTGKREFHTVAAEYARLGIEAEIFPFHPDLASKMAQADLAISRAGASTVWELAANALPAIFVPYPHAAADHQRYNALFIQKRGGAELYEDGLDLWDLDLYAMSRALMELFEPEGAKKIAKEILRLI
ncbi:MAG: UDP-N-acetylglucosamine--N-acetylmuramyl-(pentapeptide) pyrophosphoryl-undecaprenol N-acetylglucosamine transferase [Epsilonproteobacteria bacterium]|nr:UDP-N-acetylglucosamine--N-acetylmuramyl-(pentapeptide) pyrophosphoryl-undecaprenol N-acetylglucosamine transferase [Campylobacterota bacterium]